ncbi:hypothetical protein PoB_004971500 [Plakobranchus ocellatus]|uniref:Uncharacterized protein n=1 Tax=Plakobranchus ocellatus TaxID=259542 RepID=A0AAV4BV63_9GAST|nr:hypothetical protein PoB_004971500 [Plakobranchus ocellatus]
MGRRRRKGGKVGGEEERTRKRRRRRKRMRRRMRRRKSMRRRRRRKKKRRRRGAIAGIQYIQYSDSLVFVHLQPAYKRISQAFLPLSSQGVGARQELEPATQKSLQISGRFRQPFYFADNNFKEK